MNPGSPLVDHFELDALGLDGPSEATVATVDAEFELLLEFCAGKERRKEARCVGMCTGLSVCACYVCMFMWRRARPQVQSSPSTLVESFAARHPNVAHSPLVPPHCRSVAAEACCHTYLGIQTHDLLALQLLHLLNPDPSSLFILILLLFLDS